MSTSRHFTFAMRSSLLMTTGLGLIAAPLAIGFGPAVLVTSIGIGVLMVALGLAGTDSSGRGTLPVSTQAEYDRGIALGLWLAAAVFAIAGVGGAALVFGIAGAAALVVTILTRYTAHPA